MQDAKKYKVRKEEEKYLNVYICYIKQLWIIILRAIVTILDMLKCEEVCALAPKKCREVWFTVTRSRKCCV